MHPIAALRRRFIDAAIDLVPDVSAATLHPMVKPSGDPAHGDFQVNMAMMLGKRLGKPPRDIAEQLIQAVDVSDLCHPPEIAGPGFINLRVREHFAVAAINEVAAADDLRVTPVDEPVRVTIDFSSPNVAKPMHVGHLRSTVIGDCLQRIYRRLGHDVTSDNHIGDWGTQFGMILLGYKNALDEAAYAVSPVSELARLYRLVNQVIAFQTAKKTLGDLETRSDEKAEAAHVAAEQTDPDAKAAKKLAKAAKRAQSEAAAAAAALEAANATITEGQSDRSVREFAEAVPDAKTAARNETAALHAGDETNVRLWNEFLPACLTALQSVYDRLDVRFDLTHGESHYNPELAGIVARLQQGGQAVESDGATCVFVDEHDAPMIVRKADGAFTYATTDLATIVDRVAVRGRQRLLYVVDERQSEHFRVLFAVADAMGLNADYRHVSFGTVLGEDGRPYKTRSGDAVGLESLLDEAVAAARRIVDANDEAKPNGPELSDPERQQVAEVVGLGGIKYADLKHNRESDYRFSYEKMLATTGNTATYVQYAYARTRGILRRAGENPGGLNASIELGQPAERSLALRIIRYPEALEAVIEDHRPNILTDYLFELANDFSTFFEQCPVIKAERASARDSRLRLTDLTGRVLADGLSLLGIGVCEKM